MPNFAPLTLYNNMVHEKTDKTIFFERESVCASVRKYFIY